jgi:uncharacterized protein (TIGR02246 family)
MLAASPEQAVELLDQAFNAGDLEAVLTFYENAAVVVTEPGKVARGADELREFFSAAMRSGASAKQLKTSVLEADGVALFLSRWTLSMQGQDTARSFIATTVFRKQIDGNWKVIIDNSLGPLILGREEDGVGAQ